MDPAAVASALIAARIGQAQLAIAARLLRGHAAADAAVVQELLVAADRNAGRLAAVVQPGVGGTLDIVA